VPASEVPGELAATTQPFPVKPPPFARQRMTRADVHSTNPATLPELLKRFDSYRTGGLYDPPSREGTIVIPGQLGGGNWSGAAVGPGGALYVTANELPYVTTITEEDRAAWPLGVSASARHFRDSEGYPAVKPPWGTVTKLNLATGELEWQVPLGDFPEVDWDGPTGTMNFGGGTVTAGGLFFAAGALDAKLRAFDTNSGKELAAFDIEVAGQGAPVSYLGKDGVQYVAVFAGGGGKGHAPSGDYVIAFRLP
jgi:quinoprotein glucose dehydrogenase